MTYLIIAEAGLATIQLTNQVKTLNPVTKVTQYDNLQIALKNESKFDYGAIFVDFADQSEYHIQTFLSLLTNNQAQYSVIAWLRTKINDDFALHLLDHNLQVFCPLYPSKIQLRDILTAQSNDQNYLTAQIFTAMRKAALENRKFHAPTATEAKVLNCIMQLKTNQEIAETLGISISSVKNHIGNLNQKFSTKNRNELRAIANSSFVDVRNHSQNPNETPEQLPQRRQQHLA